MINTEIYSMALEMLMPVEEVAFLKDVKALCSREAKAGQKAAKEARKAKDDKEAIKKYNEAIAHYKNVRKELSKIEDDTVFDWIINLCVKPMIILIPQIVMAGELRGLTREAAIKNIDNCIDGIERARDRLKD